jgi:serine/threonine protein kinase
MTRWSLLWLCVLLLLPLAAAKSRPVVTSAAAPSGVAYVGTLDGTMHAMNVSTGARLWSFGTGDALFGASLNAHAAGSSAPLLIPGVDGAIFVHVPDSNRPLQRLPMRVSDLVDRVPFVVADGTVYTGSKRSRLFVLDRHTGAVIRTLSDGGVWIDEDVLSPLPDEVLLVGRSDYFVSARDPISKAVLWNISSGEYTVHQFNVDGHSQSLAGASVGAGDVTDELDERHQKFPLVVSADGSLQLYDTTRGVQLWSAQFDSAVVSMHGMVSDGRIHQLPRVAVPSGTVASTQQPGEQLTLGDGAQVVEGHVAPGGVVVVGEFANSLFAYECPLVSQETVGCDVGDSECLLGTHALVDSALPSLLGDAPTPHRALPHPRDIDSRNVITIEPHLVLVPAGVTLIALVGGVIVWWWSRRSDPAPLATAAVVAATTAPPPAPSDSDTSLRVGTIEVNRQRVLGLGSGGTVVYEGALGGRRVAVKRMLIDFYEVAQQEISLLLSADEHPHIVRYYAQEQDDQFVYLALGYCVHTLADRISQSGADASKRMTGAEALAIARGITEGVAALHAFNIVHRDLKPQNVLLAVDGVVKISDMGLARRTNPDSDSFSTDRGAGSVGWQAPEQMAFAEQKLAAAAAAASPLRLTRQVDLFALGCLIYYTLTDGEHPFGPPISRALRIARGERDLGALAQTRIASLASERRIAARYIVAQLISPEPQNRASAAAVARHPLFWSAAEQLAFVRESSDRLEAENELHWKQVHGDGKADDNSSSRASSSSASSSGTWRSAGGNNSNDQRGQSNNDARKSSGRNDDWRSPPRAPAPRRHAALSAIEAQQSIVLGRAGWHSAVPNSLLRDAKQFRAYKSGTRDLLRFIRNKAHHFRELPPELQTRIGSVPDGYMAFFLDLFPELLMHTFTVIRQQFGTEAGFAHFFGGSPSSD